MRSFERASKRAGSNLTRLLRYRRDLVILRGSSAIKPCKSRLWRCRGQLDEEIASQSISRRRHRLRAHARQRARALVRPVRPGAHRRLRRHRTADALPNAGRRELLREPHARARFARIAPRLSRLSRDARQGRVDIVIMCPENARHGEVAEAAASHGAHILTEKPMAARLDEARSMATAARKADVSLRR